LIHYVVIEVGALELAAASVSVGQIYKRYAFYIVND